MDSAFFSTLKISRFGGLICAFLGFYNLQNFQQALGESKKGAGSVMQPAKDPRHGLNQRWSIEDPSLAFEEAKRSQKNVLLYWGAVWCPPCNELKQEVFNKPSFDEISQNMLLVYLDGDIPNAQLWGDKLKVSGYPSLLVFNPSGQELIRFVDSVPLKGLTQSLSALSSNSLALPLLVDKLRSEKATPQEWEHAATAGWDDSMIDAGVPEDQLLPLVWELYQKAPTSAPVAKAIFAAQVLRRAAEDTKSKTPAHEKIATQAFNAAKSLFDAVVLSPETVLATKGFLIGDIEETVLWLAPKKESAERAELQKKWLSAASTIGLMPDASIDTKLWSLHPKAVFEVVDVPEAKRNKNSYSEALRNDVVNAVRQADMQTTRIDANNPEAGLARKSVISGAAMFMAEVGESEKAKVLLNKELRNTNTPWYIQSSLASLEKKLGNSKAALEWMRLAAQSAKGSSTQLQWSASYIGELAKQTKEKMAPEKAKIIDVEKETAVLKAALIGYYQLAFETQGGFSGRNFGRQKKLALQILALNNSELNAELQKQFAQKCQAISASIKQTSPVLQEMQKQSSENCTAHFSQFTTLAGVNEKKL